jgi:hypothetical protein
MDSFLNIIVLLDYMNKDTEFGINHLTVIPEELKEKDTESEKEEN